MIIGIIGAMEKEVAILKEQMEISEVVEKASMTFCKGMLCGKEVVVVRSGIGKVNAAICAQILVDRFGVDLLINTGIAGSLNAAIDIGDIAVSYTHLDVYKRQSLYNSNDRDQYHNISCPFLSRNDRRWNFHVSSRGNVCLLYTSFSDIVMERN